MKKSLSIKFFTTIIFAFLIMIFGIVMILDLYLNNFYENAKINNTIDKINDFALDYQEQGWNNQELYRQIDIFTSTNNVSLSIAYGEGGESEEENHEESESDLVLVTSVDSHNKYFDFFIPSEQFSSLNVAKGDKVKITGYLKEKEIIIPSAINGVSINTNIEGASEYEAISATVEIIDIRENLTLPSRSEDKESSFKTLVSKESASVKYTISQVPHTDIRQVEFTKVLTINGQKISMVVVASLQPVSEMLGIIKSFYPFLFLISLVIAMIIAIIYSLNVTKPIKEITSVADYMAKMKFDKRLDIKRDDELGILSSSLNSLSTNLENALKDLKVANQRLKEDYEKELKQEEARKEFIANASHELKTPLGIIKGYAEGIRDDVNARERDEYINVINDEIRKMDELILEMLKISKYDSMDIEIQRSETDMLILLNDVIYVFEKQLQKNRLRLDIDGEFGTCYVDKNKISGAFLNLFSNAVKYADKGSTVSIKGIELEGSQRIEISNDCDEFTKDQLDKIWDRFYRVDLSHNKEIEGTGLGLSIVKSIFDAHGLKYGVCNNSKGVTFWFELQNKKMG